MKLGVLPVPSGADAEILGLRQRSSVVTLAERGILDASQVAAAFYFRNMFETMVVAKRESIGFNEWQSPGPLPRTEQEKRATAGAELKRARNLLGSHGYALVGRVCGEGFHLADLYRARRDREAMTVMLRIHLTSLAKLWCV
jgi:hypothetical protein